MNLYTLMACETNQFVFFWGGTSRNACGSIVPCNVTSYIFAASSWSSNLFQTVISNRPSCLDATFLDFWRSSAVLQLNLSFVCLYHPSKAHFVGAHGKLKSFQPPPLEGRNNQHQLEHHMRLAHEGPVCHKSRCLSLHVPAMHSMGCIRD